MANLSENRRTEYRYGTDAALYRG